MLDTSVWAFNNDYKFLKHFYHKAAPYDDLPVVGITYTQAENYSKWRSDRVAEVFMMKTGLLDLTSFPTPENTFTMERLIARELKLNKEVKKVFLPIYTLLKDEVWSHLTDSLSANIDKDYEVIFDAYTLEKRKSDSLIFLPQHLNYTKDYILHLLGNVAEIIEGQRVVGGHWLMSKDNIDISTSNLYDQPNAWTGFRNQATFTCFELEGNND